MLRRSLLAIVVSALAAGGEKPLVTGVDSLGLTVSDLDRSVDFYSTILSFEKVSETENFGEAYERLTGIFGSRSRTARMRLGGEFIELTEFLVPRGRPAPSEQFSNDKWFQHIAIVAGDMDKVYARLRHFKVQHASTGPQRLPDWNPNAGGIQAFYFRDPDGHPLEAIWFPPDKGATKWRTLAQQHPERLFLGIDHTAIVISNTEESLRFYRDVLGLQVAGASENYGTEQEHLNNVFGARLRITALRGVSGPGVEFLEYLAPGGGRPYPADEKLNDLIHWQTRFSGASVAEAGQAFRKSRAAFVSSGVIEWPHASGAGKMSVIVRDPDGHAVEVAE